MFVNYQKLDAKGNSLENGNNHHKEEEKKAGDDQGDSSEEEEEIDYEKDEEEEDKQVTNYYSVDLIAEYKDIEDELILHWGIGRKVPFEWTSADEKF